MKLFTRTEARQEQQSALDTIRAKEAVAVKALAEKIKRLNDLEAEYPPKLAAKQKELADAEMAIKLQLAEEEKQVVALENRRLQALTPITEELVKLEDTKKQIQAFIIELDQKRLDIQQSEVRLRDKEAEIKTAEANLVAFQQKTEAFIAEQKRQAQEMQSSSKIAIEGLMKERALTETLIQKSELQRKGAERAEMIAKAAMVAADKRIETERKEQRKTDDKRNMLSIALQVLKKKEMALNQRICKE